jgi:hypothetical protein
MKSKIRLPVLVLLFIWVQPNGSLHAQVKRQILFTIGPGETVLYGKSEIFLENSGGKVSLVTVDGNSKYFFYDKGIRKGPFENSSDCNFETAKDDESLYTSIYNSDGANHGHNLVSATDNGLSVIHAGDKTYGPFESVLNVWADKNGKFLMAITSEGTKYNMVSISGSNIPLEGLPYATNIGPSGNKIVITVIRDEDPALAYISRDISNLSEVEFLKISHEIEEKQKNAAPPEAYIYTNEGKKFGPYSKSVMYGGNPFFCQTSGDNWLLLAGTELFVNGLFLAKIPMDTVSSGDLWVSEDGKRYAVITYDNIFFSDGQSFQYPQRIRMVKKDGKTWFNWISIENKTDVILYSRDI